MLKSMRSVRVLSEERLKFAVLLAALAKIKFVRVANSGLTGHYRS